VLCTSCPCSSTRRGRSCRPSPMGSSNPANITQAIIILLVRILLLEIIRIFIFKFLSFLIILTHSCWQPTLEQCKQKQASRYPYSRRVAM
jgi:hypothetical protein